MPIGHTHGYFIAEKDIDSFDFHTLIEHLCILGVREIADITGVTERTAQRWIDKNDAPVMAKRLLSFARRGLPARHGFEKMHINADGQLVNESGFRISPGEINGYQMMLTRVRKMEELLKLLEQELIEVKRQPENIAANDQHWLASPN